MEGIRISRENEPADCTRKDLQPGLNTDLSATKQSFPSILLVVKGKKSGQAQHRGLVWWVWSEEGRPMVQNVMLWQHPSRKPAPALHVNDSLTLTIHLNIVVDQGNNISWWLWPLAAGQRALPQSKNGSGMVWGAEQLVWGVDLALKFPRSQLIQACVEGPSMESSPHNLQNLNDCKEPT